MKRTFLMLLFASLMAGTAAVASADPYSGNDGREWNQHQRVQEGRRQGDFTRGENWRLRQSQRRINRTEWRAARDGRVGPRERMRIHRMENHRSRMIYRFRHNGRGC